MLTVETTFQGTRAYYGVENGDIVLRCVQSSYVLFRYTTDPIILDSETGEDICRLIRSVAEVA